VSQTVTGDAPEHQTTPAPTPEVRPAVGRLASLDALRGSEWVFLWVLYRRRIFLKV